MKIDETKNFSNRKINKIKTYNTKINKTNFSNIKIDKTKKLF